MGKKNYDLEFKSTIVDLLKTGKTVGSLSEEYGVSTATINRWKKEFTTDNSPASNDVSSRVKALEKELKEVSLERDILKKAVSIFSKSDR